MKNVKTTFLALIGLAVGVLFAAGLGLYTWMATATPLHPNVQDVPSVSHAAPLQEWAGAMEQARQLARTSLVEQNLPGLSVAVGAGGDIVWPKALAGRISRSGSLSRHICASGSGTHPRRSRRRRAAARVAARDVRGERDRPDADRGAVLEPVVDARG